MNKRTKGLIALVAAVSVAGVTGVAVQAATDAPWQAATIKSPDAVATLGLVDASGVAVTSGSISDPLPAYALVTGGAGNLAASPASATVGFYTPTAVVAAPGVPSDASAKTVGPDSWTGYSATAPTTQSTLPAAIHGVAVALAGAPTLGQFIDAYPNKLTDTAYADVYELRLRTAAAGRPAGSQYAVLDLQVSGDTWHLYGEGAGQAATTTTTVAVTPAGGKAHDVLTLTATVRPAATGSVEFTVGGTSIGSADVTSGTATKTYTPAKAGAIAVSATFTPTDLSAYKASSGTTSYTVGASVACTNATSAAATATAALGNANTVLAKAKTALSKATTSTVKAYVKASAKVTAATAKSKAAKTKAAKKKAKKALASAKKALTKAKKKAGSALTTYNKAVTAEKSAATTQSAKAAAAKKAASAKTAACA